MTRALGVLFVALVLATAVACGDSGGGGGGGGGATGIVGGPGTTVEEALPPASAVWFGTAYDSATMYIYDRASTFPVGSPLVAVGTTFVPLDPASVKVTIEINGSVRATLPLSPGANGNTLGVDLTSQNFGPGSYLISFKGSSGRPAASAAVTIK
jgi:hypothetical protein